MEIDEIKSKDDIVKLLSFFLHKPITSSGIDWNLIEKRASEEGVSLIDFMKIRLWDIEKEYSMKIKCCGCGKNF